MDERFCRVGDVELCYETFGDPSGPALLLVMGLGTQMVGWHEDFCRELAGDGFHVIRFDNRDCGRSTWLDHVPPPPLWRLLLRQPGHVAYDLDDMAEDAAGLLDELGIERAHVVGASMGGMIAQVLAGRHPDRVLSLVSIMSTTGGRWVGQPAFRVLPALLRSAPREREAFIENVVRVFKLIGSPGFPRDEAELRELGGLSFDRGITAGGTARQLAAIMTSGDRTSALARIRAPTVVIHGTEDRLVKPSGGEATVRAIPGSRLVSIDGMGHDLPRGAWPRILDTIVDNARSAERPREAQPQPVEG